MSDSPDILFEEKQYLAFNKHSLVWRTCIAIICFVAYFWSENPKPVEGIIMDIPASPINDHSGKLFFWMGVSLLVLSVALVFVLHLHTKVSGNSVIIDGLWTKRRVKIDLQSIVKAEVVKYSGYSLLRPVYNLHTNGSIRFYTHGSDAIELTDRDGLKYRIGTQRPNEFLTAVNKSITS